MNVRTAKTRLQWTTVTLGATLPPLLRRMRHELVHDQAFQPPTATMMWGTYAIGVLAYIDALTLGRRPRRDPLSAAAVAGGVMGAGLLVGGMGAFQGPRQVTGTESGKLVTSGVYRYSRNPQYAGFLLLAAAGAVVTRSWPAAAVTAGLATTYRYWIGVEEAALERRFGAEYLRYKSSAARWIGPAAACPVSPSPARKPARLAPAAVVSFPR